jgi:dienelactone hydrolase
MKPWFLLMVMILAGAPGRSAVRTETITYKHGKIVLEGTLAYDDAVTDKRPGVIVVHEWKGPGPYVRRRVEQLAGLGYVALAIDMYGKGVRPATHEEAAKVSGIYRSDRKLMRDRARAGLDVLRKNPRVDPAKIAALGYCFGGTAALELARAGENLDGVVSFHGGLETPMPAGPGDIKAKILVLHGGDDSFVNPHVPAFQDEMRRAGADWQMIVYGNAVHAFTVPEAGNDPSKGTAYDEKADQRSWQAMRLFLEEVFR